MSIESAQFVLSQRIQNSTTFSAVVDTEYCVECEGLAVLGHIPSKVFGRVLEIWASRGRIHEQYEMFF
jgi:hypothetical protein